MQPLARKLDRSVLLCLGLFLTAAPALRADVTVRYRSDMTGASMPSGMDLSSSTYIKGNKVRTAASGVTMIIDAVKQEITLIDAAHKTFATVPASQYAKSVAGAVPVAPGAASDEVQAMLAKMKTKVDSKNTGRTDVILGIQAVERETTATIEMPMPGDMPGMQMRMVIHMWTAKPEELVRVPALRELAALNAWQQYFMNATGSLEQLGPMASALAPLQDAMRTDGVILRTHEEMFMSMPMPGAAAVSEPAPKPLMEMGMQLEELSAEPLDDALFRAPGDYAPADFGAMMKGAVQDVVKTATAATEKPAAPRPDGAKAYVPSLSPVKRVDPIYPDTAGGQGVVGDVEMLATIDPQGNVTNVEALTGPQFMRQPAMDAVKQWKFRPVLRDGQPVIALTRTDVIFGPTGGGPTAPLDAAEQMAASQRGIQLAKEMPRSPQQALADLEQDATGRDEMQRFCGLNMLADAALEAGATDKAASYANELLTTAAQHKQDDCYGIAINEGQTTLGLLALRQGDIDKAREHLLDSAKIDGSPQLDSSDPSMSLAKELLDKGETVVVLQYFTLCRALWKHDAAKLDAWSESVRNGKKPDFSIEGL
jgi:TonB family protein